MGDVKSDPYYKLVRACVEYALSPVVMSKSGSSFKRKLRLANEAYDARMNFAQSQLLKMWCDVAELDFKRVSRSIIRYNRYCI